MRDVRAGKALRLGAVSELRIRVCGVKGTSEVKQTSEVC
jgi:hypothetical protein